VGRRHQLGLIATLAVALGDEPAKEVRLFKAGWNDTENGRYLFDEQAAELVMAAYAAHQVDRMIDLEHLSLDEESPNFDPDARGWCKLELRDGELWAIDIAWNEDGQDRIRKKKQRYVSPAFLHTKSGRVTKIVNIALTALPATHGTEELIAAARASTRDLRKLSTGPSLGDLQRAVGAALADRYPPPEDNAAPYIAGPWVCDVFDATVVYEYDGKLFESTYTFDGSVATLGAPVEVKRTYAPLAQNRMAQLSTNGGSPMDPKLIKDALDAIEAGDTAKAMEILKGLVASAAGAPPGDPAADPNVEAEVAPPAEVAAAAARLMKLTNKTTLSEAVEEAESYQESHLALLADRKKIAEREKALETTERRNLVATLIKLAVEIPATAWSDQEGTVPCKRLQDEPIAELRARVAKLSAVRPELLQGSGGVSGGGPKPPVKGAKYELTEREIEMCRDKKIDPEKYAQTRAKIRARSHNASESN
jgi:hypothetical protein